MTILICMIFLILAVFARMEQNDLEYWQEYWFNESLDRMERYRNLTRDYDEAMGRLREAREQLENINKS